MAQKDVERREGFVIGLAWLGLHWLAFPRLLVMFDMRYFRDLTELGLAIHVNSSF